MIVYHQLARKSVKSVLKSGLNPSDKGSKSHDPAIQKTDRLLDAYRPPHIIKANVSREHNIYAFMPAGHNEVISIVDGSIIQLSHLAQDNQQALLAIEIDSNLCYVSDLDGYDEAKSAITEYNEASLLQMLAEEYWKRIVPLKEYQKNSLKRPEIMITYGIPPQSIKLIT